MKTILVPTDFSDVSANALNYAANLAQFTKSKLLLFNVYHVPMIVSEVPFVLTMDDIQLEEASDEQMGLIVEELQKKYGKNLDVEYLSSQGFASDEITDLAKEKNCDLIVMGTKGMEGSTNFWGGNTVDVIKHTHCDVLVIPEKAEFKKIDKIVFAFDYKFIKDSSLFRNFLELASLFDSEILIFNMQDSRVHPAADKELEGIKLEHVFENVKHKYVFSEHENIVDAINTFADVNNAEMICMIRKSHNLFQQILSKSNTKRMALHTHLPLLILHEQTVE